MCKNFVISTAAGVVWSHWCSGFLHFHVHGALAGVLPRTWVSLFQTQATGHCAAKDLLLI